VGIELADVAGVQPAVLQRLGGGGRIAVIALEVAGAAAQDLAVVGDADLYTLEGGTHGSKAHLLAVDGDYAGRFGEAVPFADVHSDRAEVREDLGSDGRRARDGYAHAVE